MTVDMSLTDFNQNPSRAARLADSGDVIILRRGKPAYRLSRIVPSPSQNRIAELLDAGLLAPARAQHADPRASARHTPVPTDVDLGLALDADRRRLDA